MFMEHLHLSRSEGQDAGPATEGRWEHLSCHLKGNTVANPEHLGEVSVWLPGQLVSHKQNIHVPLLQH